MAQAVGSIARPLVNPGMGKIHWKVYWVQGGNTNLCRQPLGGATVNVASNSPTHDGDYYWDVYLVPVTFGVIKCDNRLDAG